MPVTYVSEANSGYLGTFSVGSPLTALVEVKHINLSKYTIPKLSRTHLLSLNTTEEYTPGLLDPGIVECSGNFIGTVDQLDTLDTLAQNQTVFGWAFTMPVQNRSKTTTFTGTGFIVKNDIGPIEANRVIEYALSIQVAGFVSAVTA